MLNKLINKKITILLNLLCETYSSKFSTAEAKLSIIIK